MTNGGWFGPRYRERGCAWYDGPHGGELAFDSKRDEEVVIHYPYNRDRAELFNARADAFERLDHPCIAPVLHREVTERGLPFYTQPKAALCPGDVAWIVRNDSQVLTLAALVHWFVDVADALRRVHDSGFLHLRLTPSCIRIGREGRQVFLAGHVWNTPPVWLADPRHQLMLGIPNPYYAAPEQDETAGDRGVDTRTDVYGLAAVLHGTIHPPDDRQRHFGIRAAISEKTLPDLPAAQEDRSLLNRVDAICLAALDADPANRPPTAGALSRALRQALR